MCSYKPPADGRVDHILERPRRSVQCGTRHLDCHRVQGGSGRRVDGLSGVASEEQKKELEAEEELSLTRLARSKVAPLLATSPSLVASPSLATLGSAAEAEAREQEEVQGKQTEVGEEPSGLLIGRRSHLGGRQLYCRQHRRSQVCVSPSVRTSGEGKN